MNITISSGRFVASVFSQVVFIDFHIHFKDPRFKTKTLAVLWGPRNKVMGEGT
jgi:hypothetical protein